MSESRYKKIGVVKQKELDKDFDIICEKHRNLATSYGLKGDLKFIKEKGKILIYIAI
jgi:hypothetical protein